MKLKSCPNCGNIGRNMDVWMSPVWICVRDNLIQICSKYHVECPCCYWCGKTMPFKWMAKLFWNLQRRRYT